MQRTMKVISMMFILFAAATFSFGQETVGSLDITTKDSSGALVPGVAVTITSAEGTAGFRRTVTTSSDGNVRVPQVPPGNYTITAAATSGFAESSARVAVELGKASQVNLEMGVKAATVDVTVTGTDAPPLDSTSSEISTSVSSEKIDSLPKGNGFTSILKIIPGVRQEANAGNLGGISIDGATNAENSFVIDGQEVTNYRNAGINNNNNVPFGMIQEVQVKSSGFNAEFGGATGGVINVVTKGGNNTFRGDFGMQFEPSTLQGGNRPGLSRFTDGISINSTDYVQNIEYITSPKSDYVRTLPSLNLSGPIVKDRVWFFGSYSPQLLDQNVTTQYYSNNSAAKRITYGTQTRQYKEKQEYAFGRIDASPFSKLRLTGTYLWNPLIQEGALPYGTISFNGDVPNDINQNCFDFQGTLGAYCGNEYTSRQGGRQNGNNVTFQAVYTPFNNFVGSFRYSRGFLNEKLGNYFKVGGTTRYICEAGNTSTVIWSPDACSNGTSDPVNDFSVKDVSIRTNYEGDATFLFSGGGRHELKGGYAHQTIFNDLLKNDTRRIYLDYGISLSNNGSAPTQASAAVCTLGPADGSGIRRPIIADGCLLGYGRLYRYNESGTGSNLNQAIYIQDKWQPFRRLTLNLGVRFEKEALPSFNEFDAPFSFGWGDKIAPRLGFAYDITGDGKTKIFGSFGKFYDRLKFKMAQGSFGGNFYRVDWFEILANSGPFRNAFTIPSVLGNFTDPIGGACEATGFIGTGISRCQLDYRVASNTPGADIEEAGGVDVDLKPYQQREFTFGLERQISRNYVLKGRYTNKKLLNTVEDAGAISAAGSEIYITGNPGQGLHADFLQDFGYAEPYATPRRNYNAIEVQLDRRFANNYYFNVNYTYSRLRGNYSGLANSDESGRSDPGVNRSFDLPHIGFTAKGESDYGPLATDRPHVVNAYGGYVLDWKGTSNETEFGAVQTFQSGTPQSTLISFIVPIFLNGRGDMGRTPMYSQTDINVAHRYRFGRDNKYAIEANLNINNLWDQKTVTSYFTTIGNKSVYSFLANYNYGCTSGDFPCLLNKFNSGALYDAIVANMNTNTAMTDPRPTSSTNPAPRNATPINRNALDQRYGMESGYQGPRGVRFGFRFFF
jgi:hypothetical protein